MQAHSGKVLLIEDRLSTIKLVSDTLIEAGHQVFVANTGEKGITRALKIMPELIILDIMMPGIDGYETCTRLKELPELAEIPIIFSSALSETFDKVKAFNMGAVDYLSKPIEPLELVERVNMHLSLYRLRHKLELEVEARTKQLKEQNEELKTAWKKAKESNRAKEEFLAVLSHELRSPLNPIVSMTSLLIDETSNPEHLDLLNGVYSAAEHMNGLVGDLLEYASDEAKEPDVREYDFNLPEFLQSSLMYFQNLAQEVGFLFYLNTAPEVPEIIRTDKIRLRQILENLLNNAFKFCDKGEIRLSCYLENGDQQELVFCVSDTGIGIPEDKQEFIFEPFCQVDSSATRSYPGVGLGLSIAKRMAGKLGGRLNLESQEGEGTRLYFHLPLQS